jgi:glycerophosphoryl diester phosphodiesterase
MGVTIFMSHRGQGTPFPAQTRMAFTAAIAQGVSGFEVDLRVTRDRVLVLAHNKNFLSLNGDERIVNTLDWSIVSSFRSADGHGVLRFDEFVREFAGYRWLLDIKKRTGPSSIDCLRAWAVQHGKTEFLEQNCHFLVWTGEHLRMLRQGFPGARLALNKRQCLFAALRALSGAGPRFFKGQPGNLVSVPSGLLRSPRLINRLVQSLQRTRQTPMLYLPQSAAEVELALSLKFEYVLTDFPEHAQAGLRGRPSDA